MRSNTMWFGLSLREIVQVAVLAALSLIGMALTGPVHALRIFGIQTAAVAPFLAFFGVFALVKVPKPGVMVLFSVLGTIVTIAIHFTAFIYSVLAALLAELITLAVFRSYASDRSKVTCAVLRVMLQLPVQIAYMVLVLGTSFDATILLQLVVVVVVIVALVLSLAGACLGIKVSKELKRSGKLSG